MGTDPEKLLEQLKELEERLSNIKSRLRQTCTGNVEDSLLTIKNINLSIDLMKKINPSDQNFINALKSLRYFAKKTNEELIEITKNHALKPIEIPQKNTYNQKLKCKLPQNRLI